MDTLPAAGEQQGCLSVLLVLSLVPKPRETNSMRCDSCPPAAAHSSPVTSQQAQRSEGGAVAGKSGMQGGRRAWIWAPKTSRKQSGGLGREQALQAVASMGENVCVYGGGGQDGADQPTQGS